MQELRITPVGDCALSVEFANEISPSANAKVQALEKSIEKLAHGGIVETIPAFRSLLVMYNPIIISYNDINNLLLELCKANNSAEISKAKVFHIPVCYGGEFGEDLGDVAAHTGLSTDEIINLHSNSEYLIYMLGFLPGFPYLGGLDKRLFTPRLSSPRTLIPAGSVGIGGEQTGIYPLASPGGWRLIGRTPLKIYDNERSEPILYRAGDYIKFDPISIDEYREIEKLSSDGEYVCKNYERGEA